MPGGVVSDPHVFVSIDPSGLVTIVAHRAEMGTGATTSLPMVVADELEADWSRVKVVQSPGDEKKYGNQNTDGSRSMRHFIQPMRECGAAARQMLETAAAQRWGVPVGEVQAQNHEVVHKPSGRKLGYGDLAAAASALPTPPADQIKLKDQAAFRYLGKGNVQIVDLFDITTGRAVYGIDTKLAGHEIRGHCPAAGDGRQARLLRRHRGDEGAGGREDRRHRGHPAAVEIPADRRRRGHRAQHLGGDQGA